MNGGLLRDYLGMPNAILSPILDGILNQPNMKGLDTHVTDDVNDLFDLCKQSIWGTSNCFAAVIFTAANETNIEYSFALDNGVVETGFNGLRTDNSLLATRILPLQWAIDSQVNNIPAAHKPSELGWAGSFFESAVNVTALPPPTEGAPWLAFIGDFVGPVFILILIGVVYHLSIFVAGERQTSISELMQAQMVTNTPRILSTVLSFLIIYLPGFIICSILLTQLLFERTSDILLIFLTILAGTSITVSAHFLASFFGKAQLAGLYTSTLAFALALVALDAILTASFGSSGPKTPEVYALSAIFPPYTWATLISDIAKREFKLQAFSLDALAVTNTSQFIGIGETQSTAKQPTQQTLPGYIYVIFFILQIIVYGAATFGVERMLWSVKREGLQFEFPFCDV